MQIQSKDSSSCTDVEPRFAWNDEEVAVGFACSHGTILWVRMTPAEASKLATELFHVVEDITEPT
jgi:hypothetical protein